MIWVPMVEVSREIIPRKHQGEAMGLMSSGTSYGVFVNSLLLTTMLPAYGWRCLWMVTCALVALLASVGFLRLRRAKTRNTYDPAASVEKLSMRKRLGSLPKAMTVAILFMMFLNGLSCIPFQTYLSAFLLNETGYPNTAVARIWRTIAVVGKTSWVS